MRPYVKKHTYPKHHIRDAIGKLLKSKQYRSTELTYKIMVLVNACERTIHRVYGEMRREGLIVFSGPRSDTTVSAGPHIEGDAA